MCTPSGGDPCGRPEIEPCTGPGPTGGIPCCEGSESQLLGSVYQCVPTDSNMAPRPMPGAAELCDEGQEIISPTDAWAWELDEFAWSCQEPPINGDAKPEMCSGDPTSVVIRAPGTGPQCMAATSCMFDARDLVSIEADVSMHNCQGTWAASLWVTPKNWGNSQELSGEIDLLETCVVGPSFSTMCTALGQNAGWNANGFSKCWHDQFNADNFKGHTSLLVSPNDNDDVDVRIAVCAGNQPCDLSGDCFGDDCHYTTYNNWFSTHGCRTDESCRFYLASDIWAGTFGDGPAPGFLNCNRFSHNIQTTTCSVGARNVKITLKEGKTLPEKCAAFGSPPQADMPFIPPQPPPPPLPQILPPPSHSPTPDVDGNYVSWDTYSASRVGCTTINGDCLIEAGDAVLIDSNVDVGSLTVQGKLLWGTQEDVKLSAGYVVAESMGEIIIGTPTSPAPRGTTIYIKNNGKSHEHLEARSFGNHGHHSKLDVYGKPLSETWSLLVETAYEGQDMIQVDGRMEDAGWLNGDIVVVAPMSGRNFHSGPFKEQAAERFRIASMEQTRDRTKIWLDERLSASHIGRPDKRLQAEVMNLSRSVTITGDDFVSGVGLHTIGFHTSHHKISYTRVEKCGQLGRPGRYCLHFHHSMDCPGCLFKGNAIERSEQRGIIVHGTHNSVVDSNVLYDVKGAYLCTLWKNFSQFMFSVLFCNSS